MHGHALGDGEPAAGEFLQHLQVHLVGLPAAAVLHRVGQAQQAGPAESTQDLTGELAALLEVGRPRGQFGVGHLPGEFQQVVRLIGGQDPVDRRVRVHRITRSVGSVLSRSAPESAQTTMSSMRAPKRPST